MMSNCRPVHKQENSKSREALKQEHVRVRRQQGYAAAELRLKQKSIDVCFVDKKEIIGESVIVYT